MFFILCLCCIIPRFVPISFPTCYAFLSSILIYVHTLFSHPRSFSLFWFLFMPPFCALIFRDIWLLSCPFRSVICLLYSIILCGSRLLFVPPCHLIWCRNRRLLLLDLSIRSLFLTIPVSMCRLKRLVSWHPCVQRDSNFPLHDVPMVIKLRRHGCHGDAYRGRRFRCAFIYLDGVLVCRLLSSRFLLISRCVCS